MKIHNTVPHMWKFKLYNCQHSLCFFFIVLFDFTAQLINMFHYLWHYFTYFFSRCCKIKWCSLVKLQNFDSSARTRRTSDKFLSWHAPTNSFKVNIISVGSSRSTLASQPCVNNCINFMWDGECRDLGSSRSSSSNTRLTSFLQEKKENDIAIYIEYEYEYLKI